MDLNTTVFFAIAIGGLAVIVMVLDYLYNRSKQERVDAEIGRGKAGGSRD